MTIEDAVNLFKENDISQIPVVDDGVIVGSLTEKSVLKALISGSHNLSSPLKEFMSPSFPHVQLTDSAEIISSKINRDHSAVLVDDAEGKTYHYTI
ncbi:MAG: CBS domain-containing protein [Chitinophagales bacterium]